MAGREIIYLVVTRLNACLSSLSDQTYFTFTTSTWSNILHKSHKILQYNRRIPWLCWSLQNFKKKKQKNVWIFTSVAFPVNVINNLTSDNYEYPLSILSPANNVNYNWSKSLRIKNASHMRKISNSSSPLVFCIDSNCNN